jgi:tight adherence protein C
MTATALLAGIAVAAAVGAAGELARLARASRRGRRRRPPGLEQLLRRAPTGRGALGPPGDLAALLAAAGTPTWLGVTEAMGAKTALAAAGALFGLGLGGALPGRLGLLALVGAPAAGFLLPDLALVRRGRRRSRAARLEAPDLLDRVRLASDAGLPPSAALARAARHGDGPLAGELRALAAAAHWGEPRDAALARLTERLPVPEARALAAAVRRAERHGVPLGPAVARLAAGARAERGRRLRDRAQRAAPKIQLIVALLLVPAVLLLVSAGMLAGLR